MSRLHVFFSYTDDHFKHAVMAVLNGILHFYQEDPDTVSSSLTIIGLAYPTLLSFLNLKYTAKQDDPFLSHPKTSRVAIISLLLYCMLISIHHKFSSHNHYRKYAIVFRRARMLFSGISLVLTTSLFFADVIRPIVCVAYVLLCTADWVLKKIVARIVEWIRGGINFCWPFSRPTTDRPSLPV